MTCRPSTFCRVGGEIQYPLAGNTSHASTMSDINILAPLCLFRPRTHSKRKMHMKLDLPITKDTEHDIHLQVGRNIRAIREGRSLSLDALAQMMSMSYQQLQKYEIAQNRLSIGKALVLSHILNVSISELTSLIENPNHQTPDITRRRLINRIHAKLPSLSNNTLASLWQLLNCTPS